MTISKVNDIDIDEFDKQILDLLQNDAKLTIAAIAEKIDKSPTAVRARIQKLEKVLIKKYVALIDCRQLGYREMVMASLRVNSSEPLDKVKDKIEGMETVKYAYVITGDYPIFIMAKCLDHDDSMSLIEKLRNLPGVEEVKTQIVLDRIKEDPSIIIPD
ncbi:MAG: Lrp/AsnC family transcriptional regulator [Candidatus Odinarchaeota archaeon]